MKITGQILALRTILTTFILLSSSSTAFAQGRSLDANPELAAYFEAEVSRLERENELTRFRTAAEWEEARPQLRLQLFDMLGLNPLPDRTNLDVVTAGTVEEQEFVVERVQYQSLPGLYVTGNFYRPKSQDGPLPTILYVCGHGQVKKDGISFGNKTHYHYHGSWFARNGYCCLTIDTLQLGEIEGIHHGTYREKRWWWNSRGYTPAGVEAWNCIRALDYLETRPEVDRSRIGVTGRSGGGAYSWWIAALDDRIQCAVPVAGITSLRDHVVNGCVEGHCDCMFMVNTFRWDYATVAALVAPRPLLISNTDKDTIFPLEGVVDIHRQVRHIYRLLDADSKLGLQITEGPHEDTQELHIHAFRWFNRFFRNDRSMIEKTAVRFFQPEQLRVFTDIPSDEINTLIDRQFVSLAPAPSAEAVLSNTTGWVNARATAMRQRLFRAWPDNDADWVPSNDVQSEVIPDEQSGVPENFTVTRMHFDSQQHVRLAADLITHRGTSLAQVRSVRLVVTSTPEETLRRELMTPPTADAALVVFSPRGMGRHTWTGNDSKQTQIQRRFQLIGTTADAMRVWDIRRAIHTIVAMHPTPAGSPPDVPLDVRAEPDVEALTALACLFEPSVSGITLTASSRDPETWPSILNLTRTLTPEEILALLLWNVEIRTAAESPARATLQFAESVAADNRWNGKKLVISGSAE